MVPRVMLYDVTGTGTCLDVANPGLLQNDMTDRIFMSFPPEVMPYRGLESIRERWIYFFWILR